MDIATIAPINDLNNPNKQAFYAVTKSVRQDTHWHLYITLPHRNFYFCYFHQRQKMNDERVGMPHAAPMSPYNNG